MTLNVSAATAEVNSLPDSVQRLCLDLTRLSTEIVQTRNTSIPPGQQTTPQFTPDGEPLPTLDPQLQKTVNTAVQSAARLLLALKTLNRDVQQQERNLRNELNEQKLMVGNVDLGYQNINYQRKYLKNEIARCHDMETIYQDVPLVSLEEFKNTAPDDLLNTSSDDHELMLHRLCFELEERKRYDAEKRRLLGVKVQLTKSNKSRKAQISKVEKQLGQYIQASESLQTLFQEPVVPIQSQEELLMASAVSGLVSTGVGMVSSPKFFNGDATTTSLPLDGRSSPSMDIDSARVEIVAPVRYGTTELMKRNDVAQLLPQPLYVLFRHTCAFSSTFGEEVRAEIQGDVQAAQVEARVLATFQRTAASKRPEKKARLHASDNPVDLPMQQKDLFVDEEENTRKEDRRSSDAHGDKLYERFPLDVVIKVKKDALVAAHTIVHLRFGYLTRLGIVVVAVEGAPGILKLDPSLLLQELFPCDTGEICPNPEAAFLGMTSNDTLVSSSGATGQQSSDLVLDVKKSEGYAFRWAQEICGLEFLGPLSQGWGLPSFTSSARGGAGGTDGSGFGEVNDNSENAMSQGDDASGSTMVLSGTGNHRAFLSQVIRLVRNRRRAWKALERQLEDFERGFIPVPKHNKAAWDVWTGNSGETGDGLMIQQPLSANDGDPLDSKVTISGWRMVEGSNVHSDGSTKYSSLYTVHFLKQDSKLNSRSSITAKVVVVEATVEISLAYPDRRPRWELRPGPGFPESMKFPRISTATKPIEPTVANGSVDEMMEEVDGSSQSTPRPLPEDDEDVREGSPHLDALMTAVNVEIPGLLFRAEPGDRDMLLSIQITKAVQDISIILKTVA
ncbi:hypothetical protein EDD11_008004 [Mortierella claussenii]|nr:hypothetical protein EDD11_008004 [Mortierella claussenii]